MKLKAEEKLKENLKIISWYYGGMEQVGGSIELFYRIGWNIIKELYNINE